MEVADRVVVVTGGARGIGSALAMRFASAGAETVIVADVDADGAWAVARQIGGMAIRCDVSNEADVAQLVEKVHVAKGRIDIFCSNAGIAVGGGPEAADADWQRIWEVNVMAHVYVARHVLPGMLARKDGYILGTVSAAGLLNHVFAAPYGVTKAAALSFFEWLAIAHADDGIRISCLCPRRLGLEFLTDSALEPEQVAEVVLKGIHDEKFLILPHPEVAEYFGRKAADYDRWLKGMRRLRANILSASK
jgi:NAD(P)-dependent dehydrogenase (short-subunit alcohol dehydrogenase family)